MNITFYAGFAELVNKLGIEEASKKISALGFSSVELLQFAGKNNFTPTFKCREEAKNALSVLKAHGLKVACLSVGVNLVDINGDSPTVIPEAVEKLKNYADIAAALESRYIHHTLILDLKLRDGAPSYESVLTLALDAAAEVADYCRELGITCLYEEQGMYFNGISGFGNFFARIKERCKNVGVCGDVGNIFFADDDPRELFARFKDDIKHAHIKDYFIKDSLSEGEVCNHTSKGGKFLLRAPIGKGDIDILSCLKILSDVGYSGAFAIEDGNFDDIENSINAIKELVLQSRG